MSSSDNLGRYLIGIIIGAALVIVVYEVLNEIL